MLESNKLVNYAEFEMNNLKGSTSKIFVLFFISYSVCIFSILIELY